MRPTLHDASSSGSSGSSSKRHVANQRELRPGELGAPLSFRVQLVANPPPLRPSRPLQQQRVRLASWLADALRGQVDAWPVGGVPPAGVAYRYVAPLAVRRSAARAANSSACGELAAGGLSVAACSVQRAWAAATRPTQPTRSSRVQRRAPRVPARRAVYNHPPRSPTSQCPTVSSSTSSTD